MFTLDGLIRGARRALPIGLSGIPFGLVLGVLAGRAGLSVLDVLLMSSLVFAGSSQLVAVSMWANPIPVVPIVATTLFVNLRHVLMGLTLGRWYARAPRPRAYGSYFFLTDESWAVTSVEFDRRRPDGAFLLGAGVVLFVAWVGATAVGRVTGQAIRDPAAWGLDFAFVAVFLALLTALARGKPASTVAWWAVAGAVAIAAERVLPGTWYVLLGGLAGSIPAALRRTR
jgi:4-azaleucine resistance transporter AzlC